MFYYHILQCFPDHKCSMCFYVTPFSSILNCRISDIFHYSKVVLPPVEILIWPCISTWNLMPLFLSRKANALSLFYAHLYLSKKRLGTSFKLFSAGPIAIFLLLKNYMFKLKLQFYLKSSCYGWVPLFYPVRLWDINLR